MPVKLTNYSNIYISTKLFNDVINISYKILFLINVDEWTFIYI